MHATRCFGLAGVSVLLTTGLALGAPHGAASQLIVDPGFARGFVLNDPVPGRKNPEAILDLGRGSTPVWEMSQWSSRFDLADAVAQQLPTGAVEYANSGKTVVVGVGDDGDLGLAVVGSVEYPERARKADEPWVHLLVEQTFAEQPRLPDLDSLTFRGRFRLLKSVLRKTPDYNSGIHAAQFLVYLQIANSNMASAGYGDYLWFGIPVYDDRYKMVPTYMNVDNAPVGNTGKFIYSPASTRYTHDAIRSGDWITLDRDVLPLIRDGLANAWKKGYLVASTDLADYAVTNMNMGWELPGRFDVDMRVKGLGLLAAYR